MHKAVRVDPVRPILVTGLGWRQSRRMDLNSTVVEFSLLIDMYLQPHIVRGGKLETILMNEKILL